MSRRTQNPSANRPKRNAAAASCLDAAAKVLAEVGRPMTCGEMMEVILRKGYWQTQGRTPTLTLYGAIFRERKCRGDAARFRKVARGKFALSF